MFAFSGIADSIRSFYATLTRRTSQNSASKHIAKIVAILFYVIISVSGAVGLWQIEVSAPILREMRNRTGCLSKFHFWPALSLANAASTTIGYGTYYPCSHAGRYFLVMYILVALPLNLAVLDLIGQLILYILQYFWDRYQNFEIRNVFKGNKVRPWTAGGRREYFRTVFSRLRTARVDQLNATRKPQENNRRDSAKVTKGQITVIEKPEKPENPENPEQRAQPIPVVVGFVVTLLWITICVCYFAWFADGFDFPTSIYFSMISLTTVGLGDVAPREQGPWCVVNALVLLIGLATVSTCVRILRENVDYALNMVEDEIQSDLKQRLTGEADGNQNSGENDDKTSDDKIATNLGGWKSLFVNKRDIEVVKKVEEKSTGLKSVRVQATVEMIDAEMEHAPVLQDAHTNAVVRSKEVACQTDKLKGLKELPKPIDEKPPWSIQFTRPD